MSLTTEVNYSIAATQDGIDRIYYCVNHFDTIILFDALYRVGSISSIVVYDYRAGKVIQQIDR